MRAIDADALIDDLKHDVAVDQDSLDYEELTDSNRENIQFDKDCKQNAIDLLQHAPTIEPQRKKGHWILVKSSNGKDYHKCSKCLHTQEITGVKNYCAVCGADMREDAEEPKKCDTCKHVKEPWSMQCHRCENYNLWEGKQ